jgi:hypothetical protein
MTGVYYYVVGWPTFNCCILYSLIIRAHEGHMIALDSSDNSDNSRRLLLANSLVFALIC